MPVFPSLQDNIDIVIYEDNNVEKVEIYFEGHLEAFCSIECGELLGELVNFPFKVKKKRNFFADTYTLEVKILRDEKQPEFLQASMNPHLILKEVFLDEEFEEWESYASYNFIKYFSLCEENNIEITYQSFIAFLQAYQIREKGFTPFRYVAEPERHSILLQEVFNSEISCDKLFIQNVKDKDYRIAYHYENCQFTDFLYCLTYHVLKNNKRLVRCKNCGKYFVPSKADEKYCKRITWITEKLPDGVMGFKTAEDCKTIAAKKKRVLREKNNLIIKRENAVRTKLSKRTQSKNLSIEEKQKRKSDYLNFMDRKDEKKALLQNNEITEKDYLEWLGKY